MISALGYAAKSSHQKLKPFEFERAEPKPNEVQLDVLYCGVCHSDVHQVKNDWHNTLYPCLPGHEIIGRITKVGSAVKSFKLGDIAGVGCMIDSCHECANCKAGLENYCEQGALGTYNGNMHEPQKDHNTFGGYSNTIVVREDFVLHIPAGLDLAAAAPLLCAGITTYSPLRHWKVGPGTKVGVVGFGGLGHVATKLALAMGAEVTVITTSPDKHDDAIKLGAKKIILSTDADDMQENEKTLDYILSTIPQSHDANPYAALLKTDGVLTIVGCLVPLSKPLQMDKLIKDRKSIGTSLIGGIRETQEVLDFCAEHGVQANVKVIGIDQVNEAFDSLHKKEADFRYVIDMSTLRGKHEDLGMLEKILS